MKGKLIIDQPRHHNPDILDNQFRIHLEKRVIKGVVVYKKETLYE